MIFAVTHEWTKDENFPCKDYWKVFEIDELIKDDVLNYTYWGTFKTKINNSKVVTMETDHCFVEATNEVEALKKGMDVITAKYNRIMNGGKQQ